MFWFVVVLLRKSNVRTQSWGLYIFISCVLTCPPRTAKCIITQLKRWRAFICKRSYAKFRRCYAPSIIWLHDGFWIRNSVELAAIKAAEQVAILEIFPHTPSGTTLLRVKRLKSLRENAMSELAMVRSRVLLRVCRTRKRRIPKYTRDHPRAQFQSHQAPKRKAETYFRRVSKRIKRFYT